jgi:hypothetical protein
MEPDLRRMIADFCSMAAGLCPDVIEEFRDKRIDWNLRELFNPKSETLMCTLWPMRHPQLDNVQEHCQFCQREIAVERANAAIVKSYICMVCWLRAGAPGYEEMGRMGGGERLTNEEAEAINNPPKGNA